jgi:hypothetical protein
VRLECEQYLVSVLSENVGQVVKVFCKWEIVKLMEGAIPDPGNTRLAFQSPLNLQIGFLGFKTYMSSKSSHCSIFGTA